MIQDSPWFLFESDDCKPVYATTGSAGFDLKSTEYMEITPGEIKVVPTGVFLTEDFPKSLYIQICSRSGLAAKYGLFVLNSPGVIDPDYKDEIKVILHNSGKDTFKVMPGDRIAQGVLAERIVAHELMPKEMVTRNGGLGSTGK